jgi:hypothetical protein
MHHLMRHGDEHGHRGGRHGWFPWHGILLVVLGGWWLLGETGVVPFDWSYIGPIAILLVGLSILFRRGRGTAVVASAAAPRRANATPTRRRFRPSPADSCEDGQERRPYSGFPSTRRSR